MARERRPAWLDAPADAMEPLEGRQLFAGDLALSVGAVTNVFDSKYKNDGVRIEATVRNNGDRPYGGTGVVRFYLSTDDLFDVNDTPFASVKLPKVRGFGSSAKVKLDVAEPKLLNPASGSAVAAGAYRVIARLELSDRSFDLDATNDTAAATGTVDIDYRFGRINDKMVELTLPLPDGTTVTLKTEKQGQGAVSRTIDGRTLVTVGGLDFRTSLIITGNDSKKLSTIDGLSVTSTVKTIRAPRVIVKGPVTLAGAVSEVTLAGLQGSTLSITGPALGVNLNLGAVKDSTIQSTATPITNLTVSSWTDTDAGADLLKALSIGRISASGAFQPGVQITGSDNRGLAIGQVVVRGQLTGRWTLEGGIDMFQVGSIATEFRAQVLGAVRRLDVQGNLSGLMSFLSITDLNVGGDVNGATFLAGYVLGDDTLIGGSGSNADRFFNGTIERMVVRGSVNNSIFAMGLQTTDAILLNSDDRFVNNGFSGLRSLEVRRQVQNSFFAAPNLPSQVKIAFKTINTAGDSRFLTTPTGGG